jgi:hypothetical protein
MRNFRPPTVDYDSTVNKYSVRNLTTSMGLDELIIQQLRHKFSG